MNKIAEKVNEVASEFATIINKHMGNRTAYTSADVERLMTKDGLELRISDNSGFWEADVDEIDGKMAVKCYTHSTMYDWVYID